MRRHRQAGRPGGRSLAHAVRVAGLATLIMALVYSVGAVVFDAVDTRHLVGSVDQNLREHLGELARHGVPTTRMVGSVGLLGPGAQVRDVDEAPVVEWSVPADGKAVRLSDEALPLPSGWASWRSPTTIAIGADRFRALSVPSGRQWLVVAQSLAETERVESVVDRAEVLAGPLLLALMFVVSLAIGVAASRPVELARRRQLEFTADASHELRTPLTVIEAEVGLALSYERDGASYRDTLTRVATEGKRLRRIVEDLLFLARSDSMPPRGRGEEVDLAVLAQECARRFQAVAQSKQVGLSVASNGAGALVNAQPEALDRLCGVLVDNACRYTGSGGSVDVIVTVRGGSVSLVVDDSGPGIPPGQRQSLFGRFRRGAEEGEGTGLGLAIADAVVRSTGGRWKVGTSPAGGAHMEVSWRRSHRRDSASERRAHNRKAQVV